MPNSGPARIGGTARHDTRLVEAFEPLRPLCPLRTLSPGRRRKVRLAAGLRLAHLRPRAAFAPALPAAPALTIRSRLTIAATLPATAATLRLTDLILLALLPAFHPPLPILWRQAAHALALAAPGARKFLAGFLALATPVAPVIERFAPVAAPFLPIIAKVPAIRPALLIILPALLSPVAPVTILHRKATTARPIVNPRPVTGIVEIVPIAAAEADLAKAIAIIAAIPAVPGRKAVAIGIEAACQSAAQPDRDAAIAAIIVKTIDAARK